MGTRLRHDWSKLTPECLLDIFSRLSMGQRWNGPMLVCKTWMNFCQDPIFNTVLDLEAEFLSSSESFNWWSPEFEEKVDSTIRSAVYQSQGGLTEVRVRHCTDKSLLYVAERYVSLSLLDSAIVRLCEGCSNLEYLDLSGCARLTSEGVIKVTSKLKNLKEIKNPNFDGLDEALRMAEEIQWQANFAELWEQINGIEHYGERS